MDAALMILGMILAVVVAGWIWVETPSGKRWLAELNS